MGLPSTWPQSSLQEHDAMRRWMSLHWPPFSMSAPLAGLHGENSTMPSRYVLASLTASAPHLSRQIFHIFPACMEDMVTPVYGMLQFACLEGIQRQKIHGCFGMAKFPKNREEANVCCTLTDHRASGYQSCQACHGCIHS